MGKVRITVSDDTQLTGERHRREIGTGALSVT